MGTLYRWTRPDGNGANGIGSLGATGSVEFRDPVDDGKHHGQQAVAVPELDLNQGVMDEV